MEAILQRVPESPWFRLCWILYLLETGSIDDSEALFDEIDIHALDDIARGVLWPHVMAICAELCIAFEDRDRARNCYDLLHPYTDQIICRGYVYVCVGSISHYLGLLAGFLGEWQKAETHFKKALEQHQAMGFQPLSAHTQHAWARMLLKQGEAGNRDRATELLDQASETADRLGMIRLQRLIAEAREQFGSDDDEAFPFSLSQREVEVLRLVVEGMTDGEIAEELYLSPRTISNLSLVDLQQTRRQLPCCRCGDHSPLRVGIGNHSKRPLEVAATLDPRGTDTLEPKAVMSNPRLAIPTSWRASTDLRSRP